MKGFEVRFRGKIVRIAVNEPIALSVFVKKVNGKLDMNVEGVLMDADIRSVWMSADNLKQGDEIIIKRKEVEESSPTLFPSSDVYPNLPLTPEQLQEMWQYKLKYFYEIESFLQQEGLIEP